VIQPFILSHALLAAKLEFHFYTAELTGLVATKSKANQEPKRALLS
jgi:hypothetical protein